MLITNGILVTWEKPNRILTGNALLIRDGRVEEIAPESYLRERYPEEERLDAEGQYVMPGNICAHTHFYSAFSRGLAIPGKPAENFSQILETLWWPLDESLTMEDVRYSALTSLVDAVRHGTTTLVDHHASPNAIAGSLDVISEAVDQAGLRASLCYEVTDRGGPQKALAGIAENVRFIERVRKGDNQNGRLAALFGLHAGLTLSDVTLDACREAAPAGSGFHIHVAEHSVDEYDSLAKSGLRVVDRLEQHGILGPNTVVAHAVHVDPREMVLLAQSGTWVTNQPRSNMNNAVGVAPVEAMMRLGIQVGLGNDGFSNTMWDEWKAAYLVQKLWNLDPRRMNGADIAEMAIYTNSALVTQMFGAGPIGILAPGAQADLIFVDYHPITELTAGNLPWHILFGFNESMITTTMVRGKLLMHKRELLTLDEEEIAARARELSVGVWKRYSEKFA